MERKPHIPFGAMPLLPLCASFAAGIMLGDLTGSIIVTAGIAIAAAIAALSRHYLYAAWIAATALGAADILITSPQDEPIATTGIETTYRARIINAREHESSQSATVELLQSGTDTSTLADCRPMKVQIIVPSFANPLRPGYDVTFRCEIEPVKAVTDLPDEIDPAQFLLKKRIRFRAFVAGDNLISLTPSKGIMATLTRFRTTLTEKINASGLDTPAKEFANTILTGNSDDLSPDTRQRFSASGLSHILALSGLHVGLIAMLISLALWPVKMAGHHKWVTIAIIALLWIYAAVTGFGPSVTRAVIMTTIYLAGSLLQRRTFPFNSLCAAALLILIFDPAALYEIGFQLSFAAVLSIILFADILNPVRRDRTLLYRLSSYITLSIAAIIGTAIISAIYFHTMPLYFIFTNIVAAFLLPPLLGGIALLTICEFAGFDPGWLCHIINRLYGMLDTTADLFASLPGATLRRLYPPAWITAFYTVILAMLYLWISHRRRIFGYMFGAMAVTTISIAILLPTPEHNPTLYVARTTYRTDIVIDDGGTTLDIITTRPVEPMASKLRADMRYAEYMGRRDIDSIRIITTPTAKGIHYGKNGDKLQFGDKTIAILSSNTAVPIGNVDYALICRGFTNIIEEVVEALNPDTIVIAYDLHPRRAQHYAERCKALKKGFIMMRERPFNLMLQSK